LRGAKRLVGRDLEAQFLGEKTQRNILVAYRNAGEFDAAYQGANDSQCRALDAISQSSLYYWLI